MEDEPHAVVKLLLARMESHPEEFKRNVDCRWYHTIGDINEYGNETDKAAINAKLRDIRLGEAHEDAMDELLNGPERRRQQEADRQYEQQLLMKQALAQQQTAAQRYAQQYGQLGAPALGTGKGLLGNSATSTWIEDTYNTTKPLTTRAPTTSDMENNGIMNALRNILK